MTRLYLLDIDGTIADRDSVVIYPEAMDFFTHTFTDVVFVTNQGGPACHDAGWDYSNKFPSLEKVEKRLITILENVPAKSCRLYACYAYKIKSGSVIVPKLAPNPALNIWASVRESWRKPNPGMLLQAMKDYQVRPIDCLMIGDRDEDRQAAEAANMPFMWAGQFFDREEVYMD